jgi:hypothetical protein
VKKEQQRAPSRPGQPGETPPLGQAPAAAGVDDLESAVGGQHRPSEGDSSQAGGDQSYSGPISPDAAVPVASEPFSSTKMTWVVLSPMFSP